MDCRGVGGTPTVFPRIDPAVIMMVTYGDWAVLGRQARWPATRWSLLAGGPHATPLFLTV